MKSFFISVCKLGVAAALVAWLIASGKLHFSQLAIFLERPEILSLNIFNWLVLIVFLGALRWRLLLQGLGLVAQYGRVARLHLIGLFFNTAMPGAVGGDLVKAVYLMREQMAQRKTPAMLSVLMDRVIGLICLFMMAAVAMAINFEMIWTDRALRPLVFFVAAGMVAIGFGFGLMFFPFKDGQDPFLKLLDKQIPGFSVLRQFYEATRSYRHQPMAIVSALALSFLIQGGCLIYCWFLTGALTGQSADVMLFAAIFPIGIMTTAIPIAPGGLGVGHVAFEKLFGLAGWEGGANVFNVLILGQLAMHLLGVVPYLLYKSQLDEVGALARQVSPPGGRL